MNKKSNPDLVRNIGYLVRVNKPENASFLTLLESANEKKPQKFIREMITNGVVMARKSPQDVIVQEQLLAVLIEYRTIFKRMINLVRNEDPSYKVSLDEVIKLISQALLKV
jgi:hypothetical protein